MTQQPEPDVVFIRPFATGSANNLAGKPMKSSARRSTTSSPESKTPGKKGR